MAGKKEWGSVREWGKWERLGKEEMGLQAGSMPGILNAGKTEEARWEGRPMPHFKQLSFTGLSFPLHCYFELQSLVSFIWHTNKKEMESFS